MLDPNHTEADRLSLAEALRTLRRASGLSGERLADKTDMSQSKISKIETGRVVPSLTDVQRIIDALAVDPQFARELLARAQIANVQYRSDRESQQWGWHNRQRELAALEENCSEFRFLLPTMITGLLQTPEYARQAVDDPVNPNNVDVNNDIVSRKMARQRVLHDTSKRFIFLFSELALRWRLVEPAAMREQLNKVASMARLSGVSVEILPIAQRVPSCPLNVFTVYDDRLATAETLTGTVLLREPQEVARLRSLFDFFSSYAIKGEDAREFIESLADEFRREAE